MLVVGGVGVDSGDDVCDVGVGVGVGVALVLGCLRRIWLVFFFLVSFLYKNPRKIICWEGEKSGPKCHFFNLFFLGLSFVGLGLGSSSVSCMTFYMFSNPNIMLGKSQAPCP